MNVEKSRQGYSLVEVVISVGILAIVAAGISSVTMMTSRIAYSNIYENTAYNIAQAYAEQIKSINFTSIRNALNDPVNYDIPTESLMLGTANDTGDLKVDDPLIFGVPLEKEVVVDIEEDDSGAFTERRMRMWVLPTGKDLNNATDCWDAIEITLDFEWEVFDGRSLRRHSGQVKLVKTNVTEY
jgi:prepilin-type N-terminal cleavage/methylation domain-containing protein